MTDSRGVNTCDVYDSRLYSGRSTIVYVCRHGEGELI